MDKFKFLSRKINSLRISNDLTNAQLADFVSCDISTILNYTSGRRVPSVSGLMKLCTALGTTPDDLLGYKETWWRR